MRSIRSFLRLPPRDLPAHRTHVKLLHYCLDKVTTLQPASYQIHYHQALQQFNYSIGTKEHFHLCNKIDPLPSNTSNPPCRSSRMATRSQRVTSSCSPLPWTALRPQSRYIPPLWGCRASLIVLKVNYKLFAEKAGFKGAPSAKASWNALKKKIGRLNSGGGGSVGRRSGADCLCSDKD